MQIERLAEADQHELVNEVQVSFYPLLSPHRRRRRVKLIELIFRSRRRQEYFCDYSPLTSSHFSLSLLPTPLHPQLNQRTYPLYGPSPTSFSPSSPSYALHLSGLTSLLLSLKKRPIIRYERMSPLAQQLGRDLKLSIESSASEGGLWDFRRSEKQPVLVLLDRRNDPVTPLLTQWTYQAMVHEEIGIENGRVSLQDAPEVREELKVSLFFYPFPLSSHSNDESS